MRLLKHSLPALLVVVAVSQLLLVAEGSRRAGQSTKYVPVTKYDPKRDAAQDIEDAIKEARHTHKRILLEVGGEWCSWCHTLDSFFEAHLDLLLLRNKRFVTVKINFSEENENKELIARYGTIPGYPHFFVLDSDGKLLHSQDTSPLENGKSYDLERLNTFLMKWAASQY